MTLKLKWWSIYRTILLIFFPSLNLLKKAADIAWGFYLVRSREDRHTQTYLLKQRDHFYYLNQWPLGYKAETLLLAQGPWNLFYTPTPRILHITPLKEVRVVMLNVLLLLKLIEMLTSQLWGIELHKKKKKKKYRWVEIFKKECS